MARMESMVIPFPVAREVPRADPGRQRARLYRCGHSSKPRHSMPMCRWRGRLPILRALRPSQPPRVSSEFLLGNRSTWRRDLFTPSRSIGGWAGTSRAHASRSRLGDQAPAGGETLFRKAIKGSVPGGSRFGAGARPTRLPGLLHRGTPRWPALPARTCDG